MNENDLLATSTITITAPAAKVWEALTNPAMVKQYFFGTEITSDWKVGSPISYKGSWKGKDYEDKGIILEIEPEKLLVSSYWSSMSGEADIPENYKKVTYALSENDGQTTLTITNDHNKTEESRDESQKNWDMVLKGLKELVER